MHKTWAQKGWAAAGGRRPPFWGAAEGRPPSFVHLLHCFYMLFACFAFILHFIYILFASLLGMMRQLLRQWLLPRMLWILRQQKMGGARGLVGPDAPWPWKRTNKSNKSKNGVQKSRGKKPLATRPREIALGLVVKKS